MTLQLTFSNVVQIFSIFAPLFLGTFLVLVSIFNQNIKGMIYLGGVLIASVINYMVSMVMGSEPLENEGSICNLVEFPLIRNDCEYIRGGCICKTPVFLHGSSRYYDWWYRWIITRRSLVFLIEAQ